MFTYFCEVIEDNTEKFTFKSNAILEPGLTVLSDCGKPSVIVDLDVDMSAIREDYDNCYC